MAFPNVILPLLWRFSGLFRMAFVPALEHVEIMVIDERMVIEKRVLGRDSAIFWDVSRMGTLVQ